MGVIHARCDAKDSKAFPHGKPLVDVAGAPLVWRTFLKVRGAKCVSRCVVATDDDRIARVVAALGGEVVRVSGKWGSHTAAAVWETCERLRFWSDGGGGGGGGGGAKKNQKNLTATVDGGGAESSPSSPFDVVVCVDADEVGIDAHLVERLADAVAGSDAVMGTLACDRPGPPSGGGGGGGGGGDGDERRRRGVGDRRKVGARSYRVSFLPKLSRRSLSNDEDRSSPRGHLAEEAWPCREEREAAACGRTVKREVVAEVRSISHWSPYDRVRVVNADP